MRLIVGLGNPGEKYENTRHNAGFMALDKYASENGLTFKHELKLKGMVCVVNKNGEKTVLLKPMTYMNLSGESVIACMQYYKIDKDDVLIFCDDLDSKLGRVRLRAKGSAGGHNGLKSIVQHIKTEEYKRVKIGIDRSPVIPVIDWVLKKFSTDELISLTATYELTSRIIEEFISGTDFYKISSLYSSK